MEKEINGINYRLDEDNLTAEVIRKSGGYEGDIAIPETVVFDERTYRVTSIGERAFSWEKLTSITIPEGVESIGEGGTFQGCTSLKLVQWNAVNCIIDADSKGSCYPPFYNLSSIKNFTFGNNVKFIPACLCCGLSGLTSITIPDNVQSIGYGAFYGCKSLKSIAIPESVMIIETKAFCGCESLKIIAIPCNVIIIEGGAFADYKSEIVIRYGGTVEQCKGRYRYCDGWLYCPGKTIHCTDGVVKI